MLSVELESVDSLDESKEKSLDDESSLGVSAAISSGVRIGTRWMMTKFSIQSRVSGLAAGVSSGKVISTSDGSVSR